MPRFKVYMTDQGHTLTKIVTAVDKKAAMESAQVFSYARSYDAIGIDDDGNEVIEARCKCPHCGKAIDVSLQIVE